MTKNNLSKCLAWLLKQDLRDTDLAHISTISNHSNIPPGLHDGLESDRQTNEEMARLQLAPQSTTKPRLLTQKPYGGILTPAPSASIQDLGQPVLDQPSKVSERTPKTKAAQPKTPTTIYDDSIFDIDDFDDLLDDLVQSTGHNVIGNTNLPTTSIADAARVLKGKKRKSDEFLEDLEPRSVLHQHACPNSSLKRRPPSKTEEDSPSKHRGDSIRQPESISKESTARSASTAAAVKLCSSLENGIQQSIPDTPIRTCGTQYVQLPQSSPSHRSPRKSSVSERNRDFPSSKLQATDDTLKIGQAIFTGALAETSIQQTSLQSSGDAEFQITSAQPGTPGQITHQTPVPAFPQDRVCANHNISSKSAKHPQNVLNLSSPFSSASLSSTRNKLSTEELVTLQTFLNVPLDQCDRLLQNLEASRAKVSKAIADQIYESDSIPPELREELRLIKTRIAALKEIAERRDQYQALRHRVDSLKADMASAMANANDIDADDACAEMLLQLRQSRPELQATESLLFGLLQQAGWPADEKVSDDSIMYDLQDHGTQRNVLVASTQSHRSRVVRIEDGPPTQSLPDALQSSGQPIAQTPPAARRSDPRPARDGIEPFNMYYTAPANFSRNIASPQAGVVLDDEFDDAFGDENDMIDIAQAFETEQSFGDRNYSTTTKPREVLSSISDNIRRTDLVNNKTTNATLKQYAWSKDVLQTLQKRFQLQGFRHNQLEAINATLSGKDAFVLMPTGGGKSLCYQLPSIVNSGQTHGVTVVISPLLSLMQDQVDHLQKLNIQAFLINGESTREHKNQIYQALKDPEPERLIQLLYVTPEMLGKSLAMTEKLANLCKRKKLARIVIDEAHCVSQWGHDFRPDYKALGEIRMQFAGVPVMALTATATENVKVDVIHNLRMDGCEVFTQSFNRPNLFYEVRVKQKGQQVLASIAETITNSHSGESGIVYCLSRKDCERIAQQLQNKHSIRATHYHAGMDSEARIDVQKQWQAGRFDVIVATIAFGMGIDKPDVRFVMHHTIPKSLEGYYQETGRAGRDGKESRCYLYYGYGDTTSLKRMIDDNKDASWQQKERQKHMLRNVVQFCENSSDCRRVQVLAYFNEHFSKDQCHETCDNCQSGSKFQWKDFSSHAKNIIRLVEQLDGNNVTLLHCVDIYRGVNSRKVSDMDHSQLRQFGNGSDLDRGEVERLFYRLISEDAIAEKNKMNGAGFATAYICLGAHSRSFLDGHKSLKIQVRTSSNAKLPLKPGKKASKKRQRGTGVSAADDCPASTNVSSPIERRRSGKRKANAAQQDTLTSEYDDNDDDIVSFAPIRRAGKAAPSRTRPIGPPITIDEKIARLDDAHRHILQVFVDSVSQELREVAMQKGLRQRPLSDTVLREIGIAFPTTVADLHDVPGLSDDKITMYGSLLMKHVNNARNDYAAIVSAQGGSVSIGGQAKVVEISDDEILEENFITDDENDYLDLEAAKSHYFDARSRTGTSRPRAGSSQRTVSNESRAKSRRRNSPQSRKSGTNAFSRGKSVQPRKPFRNTSSRATGKKKQATGLQTSKANGKNAPSKNVTGTTSSKGARGGAQTSLIGMMPT